MAGATVILAWIASGSVFGFSDTWQLKLMFNTAMTTVRFPMVFVIQKTQIRDGEAIQVKLDELIRAKRGAHDGLLDIEELSEAELDAFRQADLELARAAHDDIRADVQQTGSLRIEFPEAVHASDRARLRIRRTSPLRGSTWMSPRQHCRRGARDRRRPPRAPRRHLRRRARLPE